MPGKPPRIPTWESPHPRRITCSRPRHRYPISSAPSTSDGSRRFGVTHEVWGSADSVGRGGAARPNTRPGLDRVMDSYPISRQGGLGPWKLVRISDAFPAAWISPEAREAPNWKALFVVLSFEDARPSLLRARRSPCFLVRVAGTRGNRARLGREDGDRRAQRPVYPGRAADFLPRLGFPGQRRSPSTGTQSQRRTAGGSLGRNRNQSHQLPVPSHRSNASDCHSQSLRLRPQSSSLSCPA